MYFLNFWLCLSVPLKTSVQQQGQVQASTWRLNDFRSHRVYTFSSLLRAWLLSKYTESRSLMPTAQLPCCQVPEEIMI